MHSLRILSVAAVVATLLQMDERPRLGSAGGLMPVSNAEALAVVREIDGNATQSVETIRFIDQQRVFDRPEHAHAAWIWHVRTPTREYDLSVFGRSFYVWRDRLFREQKETFYREPYVYSSLSKKMMALEQTEKIARAYMAFHCKQYGTYNQVGRMKSTINEFTNVHIYRFSQVLPGGATGPSICGVNVDTVRGQVVSASESHHPVLVDTRPTLDAAQATESAIRVLMPEGGRLRIGTKPLLRVLPPDLWNVERLAWVLRIHGWVWLGEKKDSGQGILEVLVDAHNGDILDVDDVLVYDDSGVRRQRIANHPLERRPPPQMTINARTVALAYPPIVRGGRAYLFVDYLSSHGVTLRELAKGTFEARAGRSHVQFAVGRPIEGSGTRRALPAPIEVNGKTYIPIELFGQLINWRIEFDARSNTLRLEEPTAQSTAPK